MDLMAVAVAEGMRWGAPVIIASLAAEEPLVTTPSEGTRAPGATTTATPTPTDDAGTCSPAHASRPGLSTRCSPAAMPSASTPGDQHR